MSEEEWTLEQEEAPKKKRFPRWALFGCVGCMGLIALLVIGLVAVTSMVTVTEEEGLARLDELLPYDELPESLDYVMGMDIWVTENIVLMDQEQGVLAVFSVFEHESGDEGVAAYLGELEGDAPFGLPKDPQPFTFQLQGRDTPAIRYANIVGGQTMQQFAGKEAAGPGVRIDLRDGTRTMAVELKRLGSDEELTEDELRTFLEPFQLWP